MLIVFTAWLVFLTGMYNPMLVPWVTPYNIDFHVESDGLYTLNIDCSVSVTVETIRY